MKVVNVDDVLKILHKYGKYIFITDEKRYSSMVDEIANLKALEQEPCDMKQRVEKEYLYESLCEDLKRANAEIKRLSEPCDDCISRAKAIEEADKLCLETAYDNEKVIEMLNDLPPVTPKEKTGHWVKTPKAVMGEGYMWYCDKCEHQVYQDTSRPYPSEKYCPDCGCHMIEPQESEEKE